MRSALLAPAIAIAALTLPAAAGAETQSLSTAGFVAQSPFHVRPGPGLPLTNTVRIHRGVLPGGHDGDHRRRRDRDDIVVSNWVDGDWALYNNRSWEPDSYNDWWHDRPDRAFPRWIRHNQDCPVERMWWSGSGWHC